MIKIIGALIFVAGSTWIGLLAVKQMGERVKTLKTLTNALELFVHELDFGLPMTAQMLGNTEKHVQEPVSSFLNMCIQKMECNEGVPFSEIWQQAMRSEMPALKQSDIETLMSVGAVLGRYDSESQKNTILSAQKMLLKQMEEASEEKKRRGKLYGVLGAAGGAFVVIILL